MKQRQSDPEDLDVATMRNKNKFDIGSIIQVGTVIFFAGIGWSMISNNAKAIETTQANVKQNSEEDQLDHDAIISIKSDISYIKSEQSEQKILLKEILRSIKQ